MTFYKEILVILLVLLSGCMVGPKYQRPAVKLPETFTENRGTSSESNLDVWWSYFEDPCLNSLIEKALKNNYDLRIALEKIDESRSYYMIARANLFPELDVFSNVNSPFFGANNLANTNPSSATNANSSISALNNNINNNINTNSVQLLFPTQTSGASRFLVGFDVLWELDVWGKLRHARNAAFDVFAASIENMRDIYVMLLSEVARVYIGARTLQKKKDLMEEQVKVDTRILELTQDLFQSGIASEIPDLEQLSTLDESKNQLLIFDTALTQTIIQLSVLLSENPEEFNLCQGEHAVPQSKKRLEPGLPSQLLRRRPDIRRAERELAAATENIGVAVADWFPNFSLLSIVAYAINKINKCTTMGNLSWSLGPSMFWRAITFGRITYNVEAKKAIQRQALLAYAQSVVNALGDVEHWLVEYFNNENRVTLISHKVKAITKERNLIKDLFNSGLNSEIEYLLAQKNLITMELQLADAQESLSIALVSVYKALGGGW